MPAALKLCGNANWYLLRVLRWIPDVRVAGEIAPIRLPSNPVEWEPMPGSAVSGQASQAD